MTTGTGPILEVTDVSIRFGGVAALAGVSFAVYPGEFFAIIGPNGAGKSTLFNCITGLFPPTGSVRLNGTELVGRKPWEIAKLGLGRTFQNLGLFDSLSVIDNLMTGRSVRIGNGGVLLGALRLGPARRSERAARLRCHELIDLLDLGEYAHEEVGTLPYGVRKRVELGKALATDPTVLMLDEPAGGMNREETERFVGYVTTAQDELRLTIVLIEHDVGMVMDLADRVLALDFGKVIGLGQPDEIRRDPAVIEAYLGVDAAAAPGRPAPGQPGAGADADAGAPVEEPNSAGKEALT
jgi:branched-chain amino acid transport system ATP-binding protein